MKNERVISLQQPQGDGERNKHRSQQVKGAKAQGEPDEPDLIGLMGGGRFNYRQCHVFVTTAHTLRKS